MLTLKFVEAASKTALASFCFLKSYSDSLKMFNLNHFNVISNFILISWKMCEKMKPELLFCTDLVPRPPSSSQGPGNWGWYNMVEVHGASKHGRCEQIWLKSLCLMSYVEVFAMHNGQPSGPTCLITQIHMWLTWIKCDWIWLKERKKRNKKKKKEKKTHQITFSCAFHFLPFFRQDGWLDTKEWKGLTQQQNTHD